MNRRQELIILRNRNNHSNFSLINLLFEIMRADTNEVRVRRINYRGGQPNGSIQKENGRVIYTTSRGIKDTPDERLCHAMLLAIYLEYPDFLRENPIYIDYDWSIISEILSTLTDSFLKHVLATAEFILIDKRLFYSEYDLIKMEAPETFKESRFVVAQLSIRFNLPEIMIKYILGIDEF